MNPAKAVEGVLPDLESGDAFTRLDAEKRLLSFTRRDFGYRWDGPDEDRARAVLRVRAWVAEKRKSEGRPARKGRRGAADAAATLDLAQLKGMGPQEVEKQIQKLLAQSPILAGLATGRPACQGCARRPATVEIVEVTGGRARKVRRLCAPCAAKE